MRLAVSPTTPGIPAPDLVSVCAAAEAMGYDAAWLAEVAGPEAFSLAGAVARSTSTMDVGVAVVAATTRTPALLAMGAGTVSQLLEGRAFSLGIGSSSQVIVESWHGAGFSPPLQRVRESVEATRAALGGNDYAGEHSATSRFRLATPPSGPVRLVVGALGPRMLRLAGAVGDGVCLNLMPPEAVERQLAEVRRGADDVGRELPDDFEVMGRFHIALGPPDRGREVIRSAFGPYFAQPVYNRFLGWLGWEQEAARIAEGFARGDRGAVAGALHDGIVDGVALVGEPARVRERLAEYAAAGVGVAALNVIAPDASGVLDGLEALAP